jgi:hypothetical protein
MVSSRKETNHVCEIIYVPESVYCMCFIFFPRAASQANNSQTCVPQKAPTNFDFSSHKYVKYANSSYFPSFFLLCQAPYYALRTNKLLFVSSFSHNNTLPKWLVTGMMLQGFIVPQTQGSFSSFLCVQAQGAVPLSEMPAWTLADDNSGLDALLRSQVRMLPPSQHGSRA